MPEAEHLVATDETLQELVTALNRVAPLQIPPFIVSIPTGQWSGSSGDYYITVTATNVTSNSILYPFYDNATASLLNGPVWAVPGNGSFTVHTSKIPSGTATISIMFSGTVGEADYQVLADVYSKSQTDSLIRQSTAQWSTSGQAQSFGIWTNDSNLAQLTIAGTNKSFNIQIRADGTLVGSVTDR